MRRTWGIAAALVTVLAACGADRDEQADTTGEPVELAPLEEGAVRVLALDNSFRTELTTVAAGTEVVFDNVGRNVHDIVPSQGSSDWGVTQVDFAPGGRYRVVFTEPGSYPFYCSIHGNDETGMIGRIEVTA